MNLVLGMGAVFALMLYGSYALVERARSELESESVQASARDEWALANNYIY